MSRYFALVLVLALLLMTGLVTAQEKPPVDVPTLPPIRPLFDHPVRDTSICLGPDGCYYLTGTTASNARGPQDPEGWWYVNEGIRIWKSRDMRSWRPLGLVWTMERDGTWQKAIQPGDGWSPPRRALWAPDIHYFKGTFWLTFCMNYHGGERLDAGTGLLKSVTGKAEGPYVDVHPDGPITDKIDASLFVDDDGTVYYVWQDGLIARMKDDMTGLAEEPRLITPSDKKHIGFEGAFVFKANGRYYLACAAFNRRGPQGQGCYDCMVTSAESLDGPWCQGYIAIPHGGHNMFFRDKEGAWWGTFFGNDSLAPFRERPAVVPIEFDADGRIRPKMP